MFLNFLSPVSKMAERFSANNSHEVKYPAEFAQGQIQQFDRFTEGDNLLCGSTISQLIESVYMFLPEILPGFLALPALSVHGDAKIPIGIVINVPKVSGACHDRLDGNPVYPLVFFNSHSAILVRCSPNAASISRQRSKKSRVR
jgi:hypothetical protein